jgi:hypothetical protein
MLKPKYVISLYFDIPVIICLRRAACDALN